MAGFTHSHKNGSFVDLGELNCPCLEIMLISEYYMRKEIFNRGVFLMHWGNICLGGKVFKLTFLGTVQSAR